MKKIRWQILWLLPILLITACKQAKPSLSGSGGKTCEVLIVCEKTTFNGEIGDSLRAFFMAPQMGLNQSEPKFTLANIDYERMSNADMFRHMRNIIIIQQDSIESAQFEMGRNLWSSPQMVCTFRLPFKNTEKEFSNLFSGKKELILKAFYQREYLRIQKTFKITEEINVSERLAKQFGFYFIFPEGFKIAGISKDYAWVRKESKDYGQGIIVYTYPYKSKDDLTQKNILLRRNEVAQRIPGPLDGSYMSTETTEPSAFPYSEPIRFADRYAIETRGLWKLEKDFMGGPFVNYVFVDEENQRVIMVDAYLYSPKKPKRDLLIQMEAVARSIVFDSLKAPAPKK